MACENAARGDYRACRTRGQARRGYPRLVAGVGDAVGPYRIEAVLGEGGMGRVFRAAHESTGAIVALKLLKPEYANDEGLIRRLLREARAARTVDHRHLVGVLDAGEADGQHYLALELVPGRSIGDRIEAEGPLPLDDVVRIAAEVAAGLDALHDAGIVHRDVKPSNVLLDADGAARLTDFGLAKGRDYSSLTLPGQMLGTMDYLAPELIRGEEPSAASDLYAFGCLVYACVAGRPPFGGRNLFAVGAGHLDEEPPDPCAQRRDVPTGFGQAVGFALRKAPTDRPPTATAYARLIAVGARGGSG
jgi:serine/threonine protein kinase